MARKSEYLQIRVTPEQKRRLKEAARRGGRDVSGYVLSRALPSSARAVRDLLEQLVAGADHRYVLAEVNDLLGRLPARELGEAAEAAAPEGLSPFLANYVTAMVEHVCDRSGLAPPAWTRRVEPLETPYFATSLKGLRPHLLRVSPVPFRRRNLFIDATVGDRV